MNKLNLSPQVLDEQSPVKIDEWLDIASEKLSRVDDNLPLTVKWLHMLTKSGYFHHDTLGRVWALNKEKGYWFPYHVEDGDKLYGIKVSTKAAN